jgi:large subunit ribosomal protein L23
MRDARDVLIKPAVSEKTVGLVDQNKYTYWVCTAANKIEIKHAVELMFKVKVAEVRTMTVKGKEKKVGRFVGMTPRRKKAIVTLRDGYKIEDYAGL